MPWISNNQIKNILLRIVTVVDAYIAALKMFDRLFRLLVNRTDCSDCNILDAMIINQLIDAAGLWGRGGVDGGGG